METRTTAPALADPDAREFLRRADPVLARIIDARPDFRPRAWTTDLPATRRLLNAYLPGHRAAAVRARDPNDPGPPRAAFRWPAADTRGDAGDGSRGRPIERPVGAQDGNPAGGRATLRRWEPERRSVGGDVGRRRGGRPDQHFRDWAWTAHGFLLVALDRPDVFLTGDLALRRVIEREYGFDHPPTDVELAQLAERLAPVPEPRRELPVRGRVRRRGPRDGRTGRPCLTVAGRGREKCGAGRRQYP